MTSRAWGLCAIALALAACTSDSEVTSTTPTSPPTSESPQKPGVGPATSVAPEQAVEDSAVDVTAPTSITDSVETVASEATSPGATAQPCPSGEYPAFGAFDLALGTLQWSTCSPEETYRTVIGASSDVVLVLESSDNGSADTIALDVGDGSEKWRLSTARGLGTAPGPIASAGVAVLLTDVEGAPFVVGVEVDTGVERWRIEPGTSVVGQTDDVVVVSAAPGPYAAAPVGPPGGLRGIDRATGTQRWVNDAVVFSDESGVGVGRGAAAMAGATIVVPTGSTVSAVDTVTGAVLWSASQLNHPVASDGVIVGIEPRQSADRAIRAVDATTGRTLWTAPGIESYGDLLAIGDGVVVVTGGDSTVQLVAYDLQTGDARWRAPNPTSGQPQLISGASLVTLWDSELGTLSTTDGSQIWGLTEPLRSPLMSSVATNESTVFVAVNSLPWGD